MGEFASTEFATALGALKQRSGLSYKVLARRTHFGASTVHRYCTGVAVPPEFAPAERLARACGAQQPEVAELHRLWLLADAERHRKPSPAAADSPVGSAPRTELVRAESPRAAGSAVTGTGSVDPSHGADAGTAAVGTTPSARWTARGQRVPRGGRDGRRVRRRSLLAGVISVAMVSLLIAGAQRWQADQGASDDAGRPGVPDVPTVEHSFPEVSPEPSDPPSRAPEDGDKDKPGKDEDSEAADDGTERQASPPAAEETDWSGVPGPGPGEVPLHWTARSHVWSGGCNHTYLVDSDPGSVPGAPVAQDSEAWAGQLGAVHGGDTVVEAVLRPAGAYPVVVEAVHVRVQQRGEVLPWNQYDTGYSCGGGIIQAAYRVDLDLEQPRLVPLTGDHPDEGTSEPPTLPYQVTEDDPLALRLEARTARCDCSWTVDVEWNSGGQSGTLTLDDGGRPFRTSGTSGDDPYIYVPSRGGWIRESSY